MDKKVAMAVAAHPDDIEFYMAGTLLLLREAGYEVHYMTLASGSCGSRIAAGSSRNKHVNGGPDHVGGVARVRAGDGDAHRASEHGQQQTFRQQLPNEPLARRADRETDGDLAFTCRRARECEIRYVGARDQQNENGASRGDK